MPTPTIPAALGDQVSITVATRAHQNGAYTMAMRDGRLVAERYDSHGFDTVIDLARSDVTWTLSMSAADAATLARLRTSAQGSSGTYDDQLILADFYDAHGMRGGDSVRYWADIAAKSA